MKENQHVTKRSHLVEKQKEKKKKKRTDLQPENSLSGDGSRLVSNEALASKLKVNFFVLLRVALIVLQA